MNRYKVVHILLCAMILSGAYSMEMNAQQMPSKADKQYEMGMYAEAAKSYQSMIDDGDGVEVATYERLADCYSNLNKPFEAIRTYESAAMKYDITTSAYMKWAAALKKIGRNEEANEIISFASIKDNVHYDEIAISDIVEYSIESTNFNSAGNEFAPAYHGDEVICVTDHYPSVKVTGVSSELDEMPHILMRVNTETGQMNRLCGKLKDYLNDGPASYTEDLSMVCFSKGHFPAAQSPKLGNRKSGSIYVAETTEKGDWDARVSLPCNELGVANIYPSFQEDGNRVYFASNREGGFGGFDIYYMEKDGDSWTAPRNMGELVNTEGDEISPSVNGDILYFSSDRLSGFGGFDLFAFNQTTDASPVNMGHGLNSSWDDYALITKDGGDTGYFTSNRPEGKGGEDIYTFTRTVRSEMPQPTTSVSEHQAVASAKPTKTYNQKPESTASAKPTNVSLKQDVPTFRIAGSEMDPARTRTIYTIQVAALSQGNPAYRDIAGKLKDIGIVYKVHYHNVIKIRVGQYDDESEARNSLEMVKKRGYNDAFVVKEQLIREEIKEAQPASTVSTPTPSSVPVIEESEETKATHVDEVKEVESEKITWPVTKENTEMKAEMTEEEFNRAISNLSRYRLKLGSYTDLSKFDDSNVQRFGTVFKEEDGEWTKVYLGDYMTIEDAEAIRVEVVRNGFDNAIIYGIQDGKLIKIK